MPVSDLEITKREHLKKTKLKKLMTHPVTAMCCITAVATALCNIVSVYTWVISPSWVLISVVVVTELGTREKLLLKGVNRILGTFVGGLFGMGVALLNIYLVKLVDPNITVEDRDHTLAYTIMTTLQATAIIVSFVAAHLTRKKYPELSYASVIMPMTVVIVAFSNNWERAVSRLVSVYVGVSFTVFFVLVVFVGSWKDSDSVMWDLGRECSGYLFAAFDAGISIFTEPAEQKDLLQQQFGTAIEGIRTTLYKVPPFWTPYNQFMKYFVSKESYETAKKLKGLSYGQRSLFHRVAGLNALAIDSGMVRAEGPMKESFLALKAEVAQIAVALDHIMRWQGDVSAQLEVLQDLAANAMPPAVRVMTALWDTIITSTFCPVTISSIVLLRLFVRDILQYLASDVLGVLQHFVTTEEQERVVRHIEEELKLALADVDKITGDVDVLQRTESEDAPISLPSPADSREAIERTLSVQRSFMSVFTPNRQNNGVLLLERIEENGDANPKAQNGCGDYNQV